MSASTSDCPDYSDDLTLALYLADIADKVTLARFGASDLEITTKPDLTPVSDADTEVERQLREVLSTRRPDDTVLGEEFGGTASSGRQWVIDPIDGTKNFVRGVPVWATLISLVVDGTPVVGVVSAPGLARRWWAAEQMGAWAIFSTEEARRISVSKVSDIADCSISLSSLEGWRKVGRRDELIALTDAAWRLRGYGDFWSYCMVAEGTVDVAAEPEVNLWDLAALDVLVREAGGRFTALDGTPGPHDGSAVASNGLLQDRVLSALDAGQNPAT
ncbi:histidinol-phosphatase [Corynebacterium glyciniphilum]|uniref:histidinol-phosphatase n=1 Tax=Corynebacterium glyciniphilum TaxID=1404244 RepID=UPI0026525AE7|nr:histidinol-phosphatase [Corynebacterium glyciniphilum]MDN5684449.1 histidinol-phosphatase [Corynebacterium glyciniphilum]MDN6706736.1 histidinol-phosphatase [Corynebacterium glyciniphilum]